MFLLCRLRTITTTVAIIASRMITPRIPPIILPVAEPFIGCGESTGRQSEKERVRKFVSLNVKSSKTSELMFYDVKNDSAV